MRTQGQLQRREFERRGKGLTSAAWSRRCSEPLGLALVANVSESGVGLVVAPDGAPSMGEAIRVMEGGRGLPRHARVVRVSAYEGGRVLIGCRWISSAQRRRDLFQSSLREGDGARATGRAARARRIRETTRWAAR